MQGVGDAKQENQDRLVISSIRDCRHL